MLRKDMAVFTGGSWFCKSGRHFRPPGSVLRNVLVSRESGFQEQVQLSGNDWNKDSIGTYSFAAGLDTKAKVLFSSTGRNYAAETSGSLLERTTVQLASSCHWKFCSIKI
jgi:hypothetical protein